MSLGIQTVSPISDGPLRSSFCDLLLCFIHFHISHTDLSLMAILTRQLQYKFLDKQGSEIPVSISIELILQKKIGINESPAS